MATRPDQLKAPFASRVQGVALVVYFALLPYVVITRWRLAGGEHYGSWLRVVLVLLAWCWVGFFVQVTRNVGRLRRGRDVGGGASVWVAGLLVAVLAFALPNSPAPVKAPSALSASPASAHPHFSFPQHHAPELASASGLPLALMAKRRSDRLKERGSDAYDEDESIALLRARNPGLLAQVARRAGDDLDGVLDVAADTVPEPSGLVVSPIVACVLGPSSSGTRLGFAREGGRLPVLSEWSVDDIEEHVVALHEGKITFARHEAALLRALATRSLHEHLVVYLGAARELDQELAACAVTLRPYGSAASPGSRRATPTTLPPASDVRVELLHADPQVVGLVEPFVATLRRRCTEMVAYLALHRHEPVTGERLRTRVLTRADVDASNRTLANTASAVRRSLGVDASGPRLHPVTSSGLYVTHGVTSDVEMFSALVTEARHRHVDDAAPLAHQALLLIKGEPLASALKGYEWFLAEGHGARLARDAEWAALCLHHSATQRRNFEVAFWALQQGLLIDPYSDALSEALTRVPRLREFGGDRTRPAQDGAVGPRGAVAMSWSFTRFSHQVSK